MNRLQSEIMSLRQSSLSDEMNWDPLSAPKLDFNEDYYDVLEVNPDIDLKELKKAYYKVVFVYHPDKVETEEAKSLCNKQMMVINNAYKILKDEETRRIYDIQREKGLYGSNARIKGASTNPTGPDGSNASTKKRPPFSRPTTRRPSDSNDFSTNGDFSSFRYVQEKRETSSAKEDGYFDFYQNYKDLLEKELNARANSPASSLLELKARLKSLTMLRDQKEEEVMGDGRDWGQVTDVSAIQARLAAINEVKVLNDLIYEIEAEIEYLTKYRDASDRFGGSPGNDSGPGGSWRDDRDIYGTTSASRNRYSNRGGTVNSVGASYTGPSTSRTSTKSTVSNPQTQTYRAPSDPRGGRVATTTTVKRPPTGAGTSGTGKKSRSGGSTPPPRTRSLDSVDSWGSGDSDQWKKLQGSDRGDQGKDGSGSWWSWLSGSDDNFSNEDEDEEETKEESDGDDDDTSRDRSWRAAYQYRRTKGVGVTHPDAGADMTAEPDDDLSDADAQVIRELKLLRQIWAEDERKKREMKP